MYSGDGDDRVFVSLDGVADEIIDSAGFDTIELPATTSLSSVSTRWSANRRDLAIMIGGSEEIVIVDAAADGMVEQIAIDGVNYAIGFFSAVTNAAPKSAGLDATVYDAFYGGWVASGATTDPDGDALRYRIGNIAGAYADQDWSVDSTTGAIFANFSRYAEQGSRYTFVTLVVSDGLDISSVDVTVRWANSGEYEKPLSRAFYDHSDQSTDFDLSFEPASRILPFSDIPVLYA